ncbi:MAG TPA: immunoglobulin domain-containing protein, partial [Steroidobacteraceae bacterium]
MANRNHKSGGIDTTLRRRGALHAIFTISGALALLQIIAACGGTDGSPASQDNTTAVAPSITAQPQNTTVAVGQTASFSVTATGTAPLAYQWRRSGNAIAGATAASYTTAASSAADSGAAFSVIVTNSAGTVTSGTAILTVSAASTSPLSITTSTLPGGAVQSAYSET